MGRIVVTEFILLDGVIEDPGGSEDFRYGGWSFEFSRGEEGDKFKLDETMDAEALLLGRRTYEGFAAAWPSREGEFADKFNNMPKYVVSSTLKDPEWSNSTVLGADLVEEASRLKQDTKVAERTYDEALTQRGFGMVPDIKFDLDGFKAVLALRAEFQGQWGGRAPAPDRYIDLGYYGRALKLVDGK